MGVKRFNHFSHLSASGDCSLSDWTINRERAETTDGFLTLFKNDRNLVMFMLIFALPDTAPPGGLHSMYRR